MTRITSIEQLRDLYRPAGERAVRKQLDHLDRHCRQFVALSPFATVATCGASGHADVSPRGGDPGFARVLDDRTLALPDSPGNNRLDSLSNLVENPEMALLFMVPGIDEILRVNGTAEIRDDADLLAGFDQRGRPPAVALVVQVRDAYLHCAKAVMRARLWHDDARVERSTFPTMGQMLKDQIGLAGKPEPQAEMVARYETELY